MDSLARVLYGMVGASVSDKSEVPQSEPMSTDQTMNNAGGFGWTVTPMNRLRRFLCLGSEQGTYYVSEKKLTKDNAMCIEQLIADGRGVEVVNEIKTFSLEGRAAKQNSTLFALAVCARSKHPETQKAAYQVLNDICRIPTHLFQFVEYCELLSRGTGWGRAHRRAICQWYNQFSEKPLKLAMHVTKYRNRNDWKHLDVLRLAHIKPCNDQVGVVLRYIVKGLDEAKNVYLKEDNEDTEVTESLYKVVGFLTAVETAKSATIESEIIPLIQVHRLVREHIPTQLLNSVPIWDALLKEMPLTALIRNLGKMSAIELIKNGREAEVIVARKLGDKTALKNARIHPFNVLVGLRTYSKGRGDKGKLTWTPNKKVESALESAFYMSFKHIEPTLKRFCLAVDVSGSMGSPVNGSPIDANIAAAAMMMTTVRTEPQCDVVAFSHRLTPMKVTPNQTLNEVLDTVEKIPMGATDCALPMVWAKKQHKKYDVFIVYTDCETWCGKIHPAEALRQYRKDSGIWDAKLIVCGMTSTEFTIADPNDPGMLDIVGFDSAAPEVMKNFINGIIC